MMEEIHKSIRNLSESDAKSLLLSIFFRINAMKDSKESSNDVIEELNAIYKRIGEITNAQYVQRDYSAVHVVCGESPAGAIRSGLGRENKVIGFPDFFAVGPIWRLHEEAGRKYRHEWLMNHLNYPDDYLEREYEKRFSKTLAEMESMKEDCPIVIWTAENAHEQTGLRYLLYLLKEKTNKVYIINSTNAFQELFNTPEWECIDIHTGEMNGEQLTTIYQEKLNDPLTDVDRKRFEREWLELSESKGIVRIWENNEIVTVNEDHFDPLLVTAASDLHAKKDKAFIKSARLIGEVLGSVNPMDDAYLECRLRTLIYKGIFEIKGVPKSMRYYSVKLR